MIVRIHTLIYHFIVPLSLLASIESASSLTYSNTKDDITITAEPTLGTDGKTHIYCSLTNGSPYTLAGVNAPSLCPCFQFKLLDSDGNHVLQDKLWAKSHQQDEIDDAYLSHMGSSEIDVPPSYERKFQFDLEDAYGERTAQGTTLEVKWRNVWFNTETPIQVGEMKGPDGKIIPAHEEASHFPGRWSVSVTIPLPKKGGDNPDSKSIDKAVTNAEPDENAQPASSQKATPITVESSVDQSSNSWWWWLLAISVMVLAWFGFRGRKKL